MLPLISYNPLDGVNSVEIFDSDVSTFKSYVQIHSKFVLAIMSSIILIFVIFKF
jgi:hypothetical protein